MVIHGSSFATSDVEHVSSKCFEHCLSAVECVELFSPYADYDLAERSCGQLQFMTQCIVGYAC